jgi:putative peptidoglycan lipid II flippase
MDAEPRAPAAPPEGPAAPAPETRVAGGRRGLRLARSAGVIGLATMTSRLLGLARDLSLAHVFGAGHAMDAYTVAFRIPNLLRDLFAEGAMSSAFVPTFTRVLTLQGRQAAWRLGNLVITALLLATSVLVLLGMLFAWPLVTFAARDFAAVPGKLELAVSLARVMFPFLTLIAVAVGCMGMLNSLHRFFVPAFSPAMFNIGTLVTMAVLIPVFRAHGVNPIYAVAVGTVVGGIGQVVVQWPVLRHEGFRFRPLVDIRDPALREVLTLMVPGTMALAAVQINVLINTMLATSQGEGAPSWLNFAFRVMYLPMGLFGLSIATAAIPAMSTAAAQGDRASVRATLSSALRMMLMLNVPASLGLVALATPIVELLFQHGSFTAEASAATAAALVFYAPGLIGYSAVKLAVPAFYALRDSRTPVVVSAVSVAFNVSLNLLLVRVLGFRGLALGTTISALFNATLLLWQLRNRLDGIDGKRVAFAFLKVLGAAFLMAAAAWQTERWLAGLLPDASVIARLSRVAGGIVAGLACLAAAAKTFRIAEFDDAFGVVVAKVFPSRRA